MMDEDHIESILLRLLDKLVVQYGVHLTADTKTRIAKEIEYDATAIAKAVLSEGGINPEMNIHLFRAIRNTCSSFIKQS